MPTSKEEENKKNEKIKKKNREKYGNDWYGFGIQVIRNLIYTILFGLIGANFIFYYKVLDLDTEEEDDDKVGDDKNGNALNKKEDKYFPVKTSYYNKDFFEKNIHMEDNNSVDDEDDNNVENNFVEIIDNKEKNNLPSVSKENILNDKNKCNEKKCENKICDEIGKDYKSLTKEELKKILVVSHEDKQKKPECKEIANNIFKEVENIYNKDKKADAIEEPLPQNENSGKNIEIKNDNVQNVNDVLIDDNVKKIQLGGEVEGKGGEVKSEEKNGGKGYKCGETKSRDSVSVKESKAGFPYNLFNYKESNDCVDGACDMPFSSWWKNVFSYSIFKANKGIRNYTRSWFKNDKTQKYSILESDTSFYLMSIFYFIIGLFFSFFSGLIYLATSLFLDKNKATSRKGFFMDWTPVIWVIFNFLLFGIMCGIMFIFTTINVFQYIINFTIKPLMNDSDDIKNILKCNVHTLILFFCLLTINTSSDYLDDNSTSVMTFVTGLYFIRTIIIYLKG